MPHTTSAKPTEATRTETKVLQPCPPSKAGEAPKQGDTIGCMELPTITKTNEPTPKQIPEADWITTAIQTGRMLSSKEVASLLGYKSRCSFWGWVKRAQPPHVRLSPRNIRFPAAALKAWLAKRSNTAGVL